VKIEPETKMVLFELGIKLALRISFFVAACHLIGWKFSLAIVLLQPPPESKGGTK